MNLVSLFQLRFVRGQFKDDWVIYGFHKRIVAKTLTISLKIEKIVCSGAEIRLHWTIQEQCNKIIFSDVVLTREKFTCVRVVKSRRKAEHTMLRKS